MKGVSLSSISAIISRNITIPRSLENRKNIHQEMRMVNDEEDENKLYKLDLKM